MKKHLLNKNQLFSLKRKTLEKRIRKYYFETGDAKDTLEFLLVLQVREELTNDDFSFIKSYYGLIRIENILIKDNSRRI